MNGLPCRIRFQGAEGGKRGAGGCIGLKVSVSNKMPPGQWSVYCQRLLGDLAARTLGRGAPGLPVALFSLES
jgi:hypothetical protein